MAASTDFRDQVILEDTPPLQTLLSAESSSRCLRPPLGIWGELGDRHCTHTPSDQTQPPGLLGARKPRWVTGSWTTLGGATPQSHMVSRAALVRSCQCEAWPGSQESWRLPRILPYQGARTGKSALRSPILTVSRLRANCMSKTVA